MELGAARPDEDRTQRVASSEGSRCGIWGVLNVTPDSFSDGGRFLGRDQALAQARAMLAAGADVIDVGGESTRPRGKDYGAGADEVDAAEEAARVVPIIAALAREGTQVSVDTRKGEVAERAIAAGARIVNDVSGGSDPSLLAACAKSGVSLVLMHNRGRGEVVPPQTTYGDVVSDVRRELSERVTKAVDAGVAEGRLWLDPGLGFAKTAAQSGTLLARLPELVGLGFPVLVGASRKSFIARLAPLPDGGLAEPAAREAGGAAAVALAIAGGAKAVRVHDVASAWQAARFAEAVLAARGSA